MTTKAPEPILQAFEAINRRDESGFVSLFAADVAYFGSLTGTLTHGVSTLRGVFRAVNSILGFSTIELLESYGRRQAFAVRCVLHFGPGVPRVEQVMHFCFDGEGLISGFGIFWDAADFLARRAGALAGPPPEEGKPTPETRQLVDRYFDSYSTGDVETYLRLLDPGIRIFASLADTEVWGRAAARGVFQSAREGLGIHRVRVRRTYGDAPRLAVWASLHRKGMEEEAGRGVWILDLSPEGLIRQASILWNPLSFLSA